MSGEILKLNCLFSNENNIFRVHIKNAETVTHLKQVIISDNADLRTLRLQKVDIDPSTVEEPYVNVEGSEISNEPLISAYWPIQPPQDHIHVIIYRTPDDIANTAENILYTDRWYALKQSSRFFSSDNPKHPLDNPTTCSILRQDDSSAMLSMSDSTFSTIFIRECYILWFKKFVRSVKKHPVGKFALSSSPGCGKTSATNFIFKMSNGTPLLKDKPILYQYSNQFFHVRSDTIVKVVCDVAEDIVLLSDTFYILDGPDASPLPSRCLTLFISSPRSNEFKHWHYREQIEPLYFPVWTLNELRSCRQLCYPMITQDIVDRRYRKYGGIPRYVFWKEGEPPSIEGVIADSNARKSIHSIGDPSQLSPTSHMLLHMHVDKRLHFKHVVLASRFVGSILFSEHFNETLENLKSKLGSREALAVDLFKCYVDFLFEHGRNQPLKCRSLEAPRGDFYMPLPSRKVEAFDKVPQVLLDDTYYIPLSANFPAVDALTHNVALQCCVTDIHPVMSTQLFQEVASRYDSSTLPLVFLVPESNLHKFKKQSILSHEDDQPGKLPSIQQFVAGVPLGMTAPTKKRVTLLLKR